MKNMHYTHISLVLCCMISSTSLFAKFSFNPISRFFSTHSHEEIFDKEYETEPGTKLCINNLKGDITIERSWKENKLCLRAVKRCSKPEFIDQLGIQENQKKGEGSCVSIKTTCENPKIQGRIDYSLIIPADMPIELSTQKGSIKVSEAHGTVSAMTINGDIEITSSSKNIHAQTEQTGAITIYQAHGNIDVCTNKGNIAIHDTVSNVTATTEKGKISAFCSKVPHTSHIKLSSSSGQIVLALPSSVDANFFGRTDRGTLTCQLPITLKPQTTTLDRKTWDRFKKEVDGTLGTGEAEIKLSCRSGNIKIVEVS